MFLFFVEFDQKLSRIARQSCIRSWYCSHSAFSIMILHLFVSELYIVGNCFPSDQVKLHLISEDSREFSLNSIGDASNKIVRYNQAILIPLEESKSCLKVLGVEAQLSFEGTNSTTQDAGYNKCLGTCCMRLNVSSKPTTTLFPFYNSRKEFVAKLAITILSCQNAIGLGEEVLFGRKRYMPNKKEMDFLLSRHLRRGISESFPVSFNKELVRQLSENLGHAVSRKHDDVDKKGRYTQSGTVMQNQRSGRKRHWRGVHYAAPKLRSTAMGVGYVNNKWPESERIWFRGVRSKKDTLMNKMASSVITGRRSGQQQVKRGNSLDTKLKSKDGKVICNLCKQKLKENKSVVAKKRDLMRNKPEAVPRQGKLISVEGGAMKSVEKRAAVAANHVVAITGTKTAGKVKRAKVSGVVAGITGAGAPVPH